MQIRFLQYLTILWGGRGKVCSVQFFMSQCYASFCKHKHVDTIHFNDPLLWVPNRRIFYFTQNSHNTCLHPFYFLVPVTQGTRKTFSLRRTICRTFKSLMNYEKCIFSVLSPSVRIKLYGVYTLFAVSFYQFCPEINEQCVE